MNRVGMMVVSRGASTFSTPLLQVVQSDGAVIISVNGSHCNLKPSTARLVVKELQKAIAGADKWVEPPPETKP